MIINKKSSIVSMILLILLVATLIISVTAMSANAAVVKQGDTGSTVTTIQTKLKNWGYYFGSVDGIFGSLTYQAVQYFQRVNGLTVDGIVGNNTASALGMTLSSSSGSSSGTTSTGGYSSSDIYLMSKCVYGEARGESYTGKVAVAAVILNRIKSSSFPNTVSGVIYEAGAFTCVADGQINLGTDDECTRAVQDAINGWDPSLGALFYFNPATATSAWIWSRPLLVVIGQHRFCS